MISIAELKMGLNATAVALLQYPIIGFKMTNEAKYKAK
jgi:hypothetical protein